MLPHEIDPRILGQRIAEARKARGKTQEEVAEFLDCSRPTYIAIEKGDRGAKADEIVKLASFLGRKVNELVPERYKYLAVHAYERGDLGDTDLAHYLRCDIATAREIVSQTLTSHEIEPSGEGRSVRMDFRVSLLGDTR
jgi:transcriptional regulator with XRE-family HTH domain